MKSIKEVLMARDGITAAEADELISEAKAELHKLLSEGVLPFTICEDYFGLEEDYITDLLY